MLGLQVGAAPTGYSKVCPAFTRKPDGLAEVTRRNWFLSTLPDRGEEDAGSDPLGEERQVVGAVIRARG